HKNASQLSDIKVDQAVIGTCTNGRIEDMRQAAEILNGRKVHPDVRAIVIPGSQKVYKQCITEGLTEIFIDAGCVVSTPTCGPCVGGHMGVLADGERCISTTNRNFRGRMGHVKSEVYLAGPYVAAASAVAGHICGPEQLRETAHA
ncbi:MAG TPA: aconitase family protein, partial [Candidatus Eremiobacteraceae bacterium]|nr:aconitase family protein [Candidatus Eremiobacteraceae bacterium]